MTTDRYQQTYQGRERAEHFDRRADLVIPRRREMAGVMVRVLPYPAEMPLRILDLGAGSGLVAEAVLARYPHATVVGVDNSAEMIEIGRAKLAHWGEQALFLQRDLEDENWNARLDGPWHAVLSCLAIHLLTDSAKQRLYRQACAMLQPAGWFVSADRLQAATPELDALYHELWLEHIVRETKEKLGKDVALDTVRERQRALDAAAGLKCVTLEQNLAWLRVAGFAIVECFWKNWQWAVFGGRRQT